MPLSDIEERKLVDLFQSDSFALFLDHLRAHYKYELFNANSDVTNSVFDPSFDLDAKVRMRIAARLKIALDIIDEHSTSGFEHHTLQIE